MQCHPPTSRPRGFSIESVEEGDRGRLLTRFPGKVRSPGRPRTLRHTGPSTHQRLRRQNGSPVRNSPLNSSFDINDNALDSRPRHHRKSRKVSFVSRSSLYSALSVSSDFMKSAGPGAARRQGHKSSTDSFADANEHLSLSEHGVTVSRILSISPRSPNRFIRHYHAAFLNDPVAGRERTPRSSIPQRPTPVNAGMRYTALWEWVCSDSVPTSRIEHIRPDILKLPGRFVEFENFATRYAFPDSMSRRSNSATGTRTENQS